MVFLKWRFWVPSSLSQMHRKCMRCWSEDMNYVWTIFKYPQQWSSNIAFCSICMLLSAQFTLCERSTRWRNVQWCRIYRCSKCWECAPRAYEYGWYCAMDSVTQVFTGTVWKKMVGRGCCDWAVECAFDIGPFCEILEAKIFGFWHVCRDAFYKESVLEPDGIGIIRV